jgi:hypothetical protein
MSKSNRRKQPRRASQMRQAPSSAPTKLAPGDHLDGDNLNNRTQAIAISLGFS